MFSSLRRLRIFGDRRKPAPAADLQPRLEAVERRLAHLEAAFEGLQDAIHRESVRRNEQIAELQRKTEPEQMARALSEDARERGL